MASSWFYSPFLFLFLFSSSSTQITSTTISYSDHCSSTVPESSPTNNVHTYHKSLPNLFTSYFTGGDRLLDRRSSPNQTFYYGEKTLRLRVRPNYYETTTKGIYKVEAALFIRLPHQRDFGNSRRNFSFGGSYYRRPGSGSIVFSMNGFWSEISGKVCLVGSASWHVQSSRAVNLDAVLKLNFPGEKPDIYSAIVSGILESIERENDPGYFEPILMYSFPYIPNYTYSTFVSKEQEQIAGHFSDFDVPRNQSLTLQKSEFCSVLSGRTFLDLDYAVECTTSDHPQCSPLGSSKDGFLPRFIALSPIQCDANVQKLRYRATFWNASYDYQSLHFNSTVIGEASWDDKKNELFVILCRVLNPVGNDLVIHAVGDCNMRLILRYPSIWNIRNDAEIVGHLWSNRTVEDSGYFKIINFTSMYKNDHLGIPGLTYEYTELDKVKTSCPVQKPVKKGSIYPDGNSYDMRFDMSIKNSKGKRFGWGYATPLSVGNESYKSGNTLIAVDSLSPASSTVFATTFSESEIRTLNISYKIRISPFSQINLKGLNWSMNPQHQVEVTAEGLYDAKTGYLCMVGCRKLMSLINDSAYVSRDCEILVKLQFASLNDRSGGIIKGTITSTRAKTETLYFEDLSISSVAYSEAVIKRSIWRMDLEITLVLISNTLLCVFVGLQIYHVKRNPEVLSFISLAMLVILSLGHMTVLVLNFEALFSGAHKRNSSFASSGDWVEADEVAVRVITMILFLMQIRLLQLVWGSKMGENDKDARMREIKAAFVSLPLYVLGGLFALLLNWIRSRIYQKYSLWGDLRSYAGLVLDGFLLPQIILNALSGSSQKALSRPFYIGTSAVRLVPHAYNQYRTHNYPAFGVVNGTDYYYANPSADFYSTAWDVIIPLGVVSLVVIVFLQQKRGGRWILPQRFRELELYQKVPTVNNDP